MKKKLLLAGLVGALFLTDIFAAHTIKNNLNETITVWILPGCNNNPPADLAAGESKDLPTCNNMPLTQIEVHIKRITDAQKSCVGACRTKCTHCLNKCGSEITCKTNCYKGDCAPGICESKCSTDNKQPSGRTTGYLGSLTESAWEINGNANSSIEIKRLK